MLRFIERRRRLPPAVAAEDVFQDACGRAIPHLRERQFQGGNAREFRAWVKTFVDRASLDAVKNACRAKRDVRREVSGAGRGAEGSAPDLLAGVPGRGETPSKPLRRREKDAALRKAMEEFLSAREREAIELRYLQELPVREVAKRMGRPPAYVKNLCVTGKTKLREGLADPSPFFSSR
jgi:RNA polymerase sigma factor (sigma-70 family)